MARSRHPKKHVEEALRYAESRGWRVIQGGSHRWGGIYCRLESREGCRMSVWSTPRNPQAHAADIRAYVNECPHGG